MGQKKRSAEGLRVGQECHISYALNEDDDNDNNKNNGKIEFHLHYVRFSSIDSHERK